MGCMGLIFTPALVRRLLGPSVLSGPMTIGLIATPNGAIGRVNPPPACHLPPSHQTLLKIEKYTGGWITEGLLY